MDCLGITAEMLVHLRNAPIHNLSFIKSPSVSRSVSEQCRMNGMIGLKVVKDSKLAALEVYCLSSIVDVCGRSTFT